MNDITIMEKLYTMRYQRYDAEALIRTMNRMFGNGVGEDLSLSLSEDDNDDCISFQFGRDCSLDLYFMVDNSERMFVTQVEFNRL